MPIRKQEGFYVFTNLADSIARIFVEGACYQKEQRTVDLKQIDRANPVVKIRLLPNRSYPLSEGTIRLTAALPRGAVFSAFCESGSDYKKLLADYEKGSEQICLYQTEREELEGKGCWIAGKEQKREFVRLGQRIDSEKGMYLFAQAPKAGYRKIGTRIYPVSTICTSEEGEWFLPLKSYGEAQVEYTCMMELDGQRTERKILLKAGKENYLDFREKN